MPVVRRCEYGSLTETLPNIKDSVCHENDSSKPASSNPVNFSYQIRKSFVNQVSPPCKSHLASISTLNKHISRLTSLKDPFSLVDFDSSPDVTSYPLAQNRQQSDQIDKTKDSRFPVTEEEAIDAATSPSLTRNSKNPDIESGKQYDQLVTSKVSHEFGRSPSFTEEDIGVSSEKVSSVTAKDVALGDDSKEWINEFRQNDQADTRDNLFDIRSPADGEDNGAAFGEATLDGVANDVDASTEPIEEDDQTTAGPKSVVNEVFGEGSVVEMTNGNEGDTEMDEPLNTNGMSIETPKKKTLRSFKSRRKEIEDSTASSQENKTVNKDRKGNAKLNAAVSKEPKNKKRKVEVPRASSRKVDAKLRRLDSYEAGTKWESGVRRSTRIRMRPLEFWRGERLLYGRVHESTVSVIGVKYASPAKNTEEPIVKVQSFVSTKYKNLIDLASSH